MKLTSLLIKIFELPLSYLLEPYHYYPIRKTREEDIFIIGFPKSGHTWLQYIAAGLQFGIDAQYMNDKLAQEICPDVYHKKFYKRFDKFVFFKSHDLPKPHHRRVIYVVRDGRDAMVSYLHMNQNLGIKITLEEMIKKGKHVFPAQWHTHIRMWLENPYKAEILFVRYEDLLENTFEEVKKIADFAGLTRTDEQIMRVIEGTKFDNMQKKEKEHGMDGFKPKKGGFFRQGKAGSYKKEMPENLQEEFMRQSRAEMSHFGYV
jgi:hypothetical protein